MTQKADRRAPESGRDVHAGASAAGGTFRSLRSRNYRIWALGSLVSNIGTWMQRTAQDWMVLTTLTHHNATAVGIVMSLQFGPVALLLPFSGFAADRWNRRKLLVATQGAMGVCALVLGLLTITGTVQLWHVYVLAALLGCATAFDSPVRQTFVAELVGDADLSNAVALNSTSFNAGRLIGPAVAGVLIAAVGTGWVFMFNAASYLAVLASLAMLRAHELRVEPRAARRPGGLVAGFKYVWHRPDLIAVLTMLFLFSTFGLNFPIFLSTMATTVFHVGAHEYGLLVSTMAVGSVIGGLMSARRSRPKAAVLLGGSLVFGLATASAALMSDVRFFGATLLLVGISVQTFNTTANAMVQLSTDAPMRGRVMAILLAIGIGSTPIGAPLVGWVADRFGARWSLGVGSASGFLATLVGVGYFLRHRGLRLRLEGWRVRATLAPRNAGAKVD